MPEELALLSKTAMDEGFRSRFITVPEIVSNWISKHRPLEGADVLDFGCGEGISALGLALNYRPRRVVGVDIMPDPERCLPMATKHLGLDALPTNLTLFRVDPGKLHRETDQFDIAYSWSVFEHVDERLLDATLHLVRQALKPNGLFLTQIAPLYYSAEGSHLTHKINEPWGHLLNQHNAYYDKLVAATPNADERTSLWSTYRTLNRITADELIERIRRTGFRVIRTYSTNDSVKPPERLLAIFHKEILVTNQIVVLAQR